MKIFSFQTTTPLIMLLFLLIFADTKATGVPVSTDGTVTFSVRTTTNNASYSPKNVLAIWVKDALGNFVISRKVMAASRKQHLVKWVASSTGNTVNATTGATLPNHQMHTITWDCRDINGNLVADGDYEFWIEFTERNSNSGGAPGPSTRVVFTKGPEVVSLNFPDESNFKDMTLNYSPIGVGVDDKLILNLQFESFPNPFSDRINISFVLTHADFLNISAYDSGGRRVAELVNETLPAGRNSFYWEGVAANGLRLNPGVYFLRIVYKGKVMIHKVIIGR